MTPAPAPARAGGEDSWRRWPVDLRAEQWSAAEQAALLARAHHLALGEDPSLIPWHRPDLDARALAWALGRRDAIAARVVAALHAVWDPADQRASDERAEAAAWALAAQRPGLAGQLRGVPAAEAGRDERPAPWRGALLWNGQRVRLCWQADADLCAADRDDGCWNPLWVDGYAAPWAQLRGRYEAAAAAAWRLAAAGAVVLVVPGRRSAAEAQAALALAAAGHPDLHGASAVPARGVTCLTDDELDALDPAAPPPWWARHATLIFAAAPRPDLVLDGRLALLWRGLGDARVHPHRRMLLGVDLRPEAPLVQRALQRAHATLRGLGATPPSQEPP